MNEQRLHHSKTLAEAIRDAYLENRTKVEIVQEQSVSAVLHFCFFALMLFSMVCYVTKLLCLY